MGRRTSRVNTDDEDVELNMTPMLDVVFILLIFFIVTSVFIKEPGVDVMRPDVDMDDVRNPSMLIAVTADNEIWVNRRIYELPQLRGVIEQLLQENPQASAMIQGDEGADVGLVLDVQDLLGEMEIEVFISTLVE
jgi:biopolymer transport protein ExbD